MITYEQHPEISYTQKRENLKNLRNTIWDSLAKEAGDTWTAFRLIQDILSEVVDTYCDFEGLQARLEQIPQRKKEYQERYDAVISSLSQGKSRDNIDFAEAYPVLQDIILDLLYDYLASLRESITVYQKSALQ